MTSMTANAPQIGTIHDAQWDYYGKRLASASSDSVIRIWIIVNESPQVVSELRGHAGPVWQLSWSHPKYGNLLASGSHDHKIIIWREEQPSVWATIFISEDHTASVNTVQFSPWEQGLHLAAGSTDGTISILTYNPEKGFWSRKAFVAHSNGVLCLCWAPTSSSSTSVATVPSGYAPSTPQCLVSGGCDHQIRIWSYSQVSNEWILSYHLTDLPHLGWVRGVAWCPVIGFSGNNVIASCSSDQRIIFWQQEKDKNTWKNHQSIDMKEPVWSVSWSLTGTMLSATSGTHRVSLFKENAQGFWAISQQKDSEQQISTAQEDNSLRNVSPLPTQASLNNLPATPHSGAPLQDMNTLPPCTESSNYFCSGAPPRA